LREWFQGLDLQAVTLFAHDWGSLIGLRLVAEMPELFARVAIGNGGLPVGMGELPEAYHRWLEFSQSVSELPVGRIISAATAGRLSAEVRRGYEAPFPDESFKAGARAFPALVPLTSDNPDAQANRRALRLLRQYDKPFLTTFSDGDPLTRGADRLFQRLIPGAKGQPHVTIEGAGHFLQEDKGLELAGILVEWLTGTEDRSIQRE
jgi:haloalkane dehalogenase